MIKKTALLFSVLLHPLFMPLAGISIILFTGSYVTLLPLAAKKMILLLFASGTLLLPAIMMPLAYMRGDIMMQKQNERNIPLVLSFIFYLFTYILFLKVPVYDFMHSFMLGAVVSVFLALIINTHWKISLHMIGLGGLTAFLLMVSFTREINLYPWLLLSVLASGVAGTSRLYLNYHSPAQVYAGYGLGSITMVICMVFFGS
jgi:hypothetical protein